jgi:hypothetical protein
VDPVSLGHPVDVEEGISGLCVVDLADFRFYICDLLSFNGSCGVNY